MNFHNLINIFQSSGRQGVLNMVTCPYPCLGHHYLLCIVLPNINCTALHSAVLYFPSMHCPALPHTALHCTPMYCTALQIIALHYIALHCTVLYCPTIIVAALKRWVNSWLMLVIPGSYQHIWSALDSHGVVGPTPWKPSGEQEDSNSINA